MTRMGKGGGGGGGGGGRGGSDGDTSKLTVYSQENFSGESRIFTDTDGNVPKTLKATVSVVSLIVNGNPWLIFPEPGYKGLPTFIEEGRYKDLTRFPILGNVGSVKVISDDLGSPELRLFSASRFTGEAPWEKLANEDAMKCCSVGEGGIWSVRAKDDTVWVRMAKKNDKGAGKVEWDTTTGEEWSRIQGTLRSLSVGSNSVWGVKSDGVVSVRMGITSDNPAGKEWVTVDGEPMKQVSVSSLGHVWGVDNNEKIWYRKGASNAFALGQGWKMLPGSLKQISIGKCGVWGVNSDQQVFFRVNTFGDPDNEGTGWLRVEGRFQSVFSGPTCVLAIAGNRDVYYRANVLDIPGNTISPNREGSHWVRLEQDKDSKIIFKQIEAASDTLWGVDKDNNVFFKEYIYDDIEPHYDTTVFGDEADFTIYNFPLKATTSKACSGIWAIYSEPNYSGKVLYQIGSDCISNDPPNKENPYKGWTVTIGSARPIRGSSYRTAVMRLSLDWEQMDVKAEQEILFSQDASNTTDEYAVAPWIPTFEVETTASHKFTLKEAQNIAGCGDSVVRGCEFMVNPIEPIKASVPNCPPLETGEDFHATIAQPFMFKDEVSGSRASKKTLVLRLPPFVPPKCTFKVKVIINRIKICVPFKADFKMGFSPYFELGSESWSQRLTAAEIQGGRTDERLESGMYIGQDESNVKIELECDKIVARKVSKMINGSLGNDM